MLCNPLRKYLLYLNFFLLFFCVLVLNIWCWLSYYTHFEQILSSFLGQLLFGARWYFDISFTTNIFLQVIYLKIDIKNIPCLTARPWEAGNIWFLIIESHQPFDPPPPSKSILMLSVRHMLCTHRNYKSLAR